MVFDKMKVQDVQLMQASGATKSTDNDQSTMAGTNPTTNGLSSQHCQSRGKQTLLAGSVDPQKWNHLYPQLCTSQQVHV